MINGFVNVLKPVGATASDAVVKLKKIYRQSKVGHLGTLDPGACGVLPIALGKATKLFDLLTDKVKKYRAFFTFGITTDTLDAYGKVTEKSFVPHQNDIMSVLSEFVGEIDQLPPQFSAISVGGVRAYDLARRGQTVELKSRKVCVYDIDVVRYENDTLVVDITCSAGTYIRSLARDIAGRLNTVAYMSGLIRLFSGCFNIDNAVTFEEIEQNPTACLLDITYPLQDYKKFTVKTVLYDRLSNGVKLTVTPFDGYRTIYCDGKLFGVGCCQEKKLILKYNLKDADNKI